MLSLAANHLTEPGGKQGRNHSELSWATLCNLDLLSTISRISNRILDLYSTLATVVKFINTLTPQSVMKGRFSHAIPDY